MRRLGPVASGLSKLFELGVRARLCAYAALPGASLGATAARLVSIGNLRVGGSGKTPLAMWACEQLVAAGLRCGLCLRGYRGRLERAVTIIDENFSADDVGDEAVLALRRLSGKGVVLGVGRERVEVVRQVERLGAQIIVVDDGFSHLRLRRDADIVLVCPEDLAISTLLLPAGPLREPASSLARAHLVAGYAQDWLGVANAPPVLLEARPSSLVDRRWQCHGLEELRGHRVLLASGIARPHRFVHTARAAGLVVVGHVAFPDHRSPSAQQARDLTRQAKRLGAEAIVWTEKDLPRLPALDFPDLALRVDMVVTRGEDLLRQTIFGA